MSNLRLVGLMSFLFAIVLSLSSNSPALAADDSWTNANGSKSRPIGISAAPLASVGSDNLAIFEDNFDGVNDTTALKARGYKVYYRGSGPQGTAAVWFQGNPGVFNAYNGPTNGYVAGNYQVVTGTNRIDSWLVLPRLNIAAGDTITFFERSPTANSFPDSIKVMYSAAGDSVPEAGTWVELAYFRTTETGSWGRRAFTAPAGGANARFAIRYYVINGGPSGTNSNFMGIDALSVVAGPSSSTCNTFASQWSPPATYPDVPSATYFQAAEWLGDTLFVHAPSTTGAGTTTINKYVPGGTWTTGVALPATKVGGTLTRAGNKLYYIGGGAASITTGTTDVYEFDPATQTWTSKAPLPVALSAHKAVSWGDSIIFVVGGPYTGSGTNLDVHYYRIAANTWGTIAASLPAGQGRRTFAAGISGNKIIISSGFNTAYLKSTWVGTVNSASSITWTAAPDVPTVYTGLSRPGGTVYGDKFYIVCGERGGPGGYYDTTHVYSIAGNAWTHIINNKPIKMSNIFNAVTARCVNDTIRVFVPGGYGNATGSGAGTAHAVFDIIDRGPGLIGVAEQISTLPSDFALEQNYPNPFNPSTTIRFSIPNREYVTVKIYNTLGQEVATLLDEALGAGTFETTWNATGVASGVYFYRLQAGQYSSIKKLVLLK